MPPPGGAPARRRREVTQARGCPRIRHGRRSQIMSRKRIVLLSVALSLSVVATLAPFGTAAGEAAAGETAAGGAAAGGVPSRGAGRRDPRRRRDGSPKGSASGRSAVEVEPDAVPIQQLRRRRSV